MADNVLLNSGTGGDTVAADDVSGVKYQVVKLATGADGAAALVSNAAPIPVSDAGGSLTVDDGGGSLTVDGSVTVVDGGGSLTVDNPALSVVGGGVEATALRVTIASDSTGVVSVDDNGASLTVDGTVATTQSGNWSVRAQDGAGNALTSKAAGSERGLSVIIVDGSGNQVTSFGGGTQYTEDAASAGGESLTLAGFVRQDTISSSTSADGDYANGKVDASGRVYVNASGAAVPVTDNSGSLTVDNAGTFATQATLQTGAAVIGSLVADQTVNLNKIAGTATDTNSGNKSAGTIRVVIATDQPALTNKLLVTPDSVALPANQSVNVSQINGVAPTMGNGASGTGVQRVTLANDSTGQVALAAGAATVGAISSVTTSVTPGTSAAHLGKAEDAAHSSGDTGVMSLAVQQTANTSLVSADGDYAPLQVDSNGNLKVAIVTGAGSGGTAQTDGATYTAATTSGTPIMGARDDSSPGTLAEDKVGIIRATTNRALHVNLRDSSGTELSVGGGTQYTEDAAAVADPIGNALIVVRNDARSGTLVSADGDNIALRGTNNGELYVKHTDAIPITDNSGSLTVDNAGTFATQAAQSGTWTVQPGNTANTTAWKVDGSAVTQPVSGTVTASIVASASTIAKAEDVASADADVGIPAMAIRKATPANTSGTDGDYEMLQMSAGRLWASATIDAAIPAGANTVGSIASITTSVVPGTAATNLGKAVDNAAGATDTGVAPLAIRDDALTTLTPVDGDYTNLRTDANGALWVTTTNGLTGIAEDVASAGGETGIPVLVVRRDTPSSGVSADGDFANLSVNSTGALYVTGGGGGTQYAEDAAAVSGDTGTLALLVRQDTPASSTSADGDYTTGKTDSVGRLWVNASGAAVPVTDNSGSLTVDNGGTFAVQATIAAGATAIAKAEDVASADADVGVPAMAVRKATPANTSGTDGDYEFLQVSAGRLWVNDLPNLISTANSSTATLTSGSVFTGTSEDISAYSSISVYVIASHASATDGLSIQQSNDGTNWDVTDVYTVPAATGKTFGVQVAGQFFRIVYTNGGTNQTSFRLQTIFKKFMQRNSSQRPQDALSNENDFQQVSSFAHGYNGTTWDRLRATTANGLATDVTRVPTDPFGANADAASATGSISAKLRFIAATGIPVTSLPANQSVNVAQVNGVTTLMGNGVTGTGSQRVTIASDNTAFSVNAASAGAAAHGASISGNPVRLAGRALTADYTAVTAGQTADLITTLLGKLVTIPYANPNNTWSYAAASGGVVNTTGVTAKAAGGSGVRLYVTHASVINGHATVDTDVQIRDGAGGTVLWRGFAKAAGGGVSESFDPPLRGTANTLLEIANGTTGSATYFNLQGFSASE